MSERIRRYVARHHVGLIALCIAVVGVPVAWALEKNSVGSKHIKPEAVRTSDIADDAVTGEKVAAGSLEGSDFAAGQLPEGPQGLQGLQGPQGATGPQGPAGPVDVCRPGIINPGPISFAQSNTTQTLCTDGAVSIRGRCEQIVTGGPTHIGARLVYVTTADNAIRDGDGDFDVSDSGASRPITDTSLGNPGANTISFGIASGSDQLVGTAMAAVAGNTSSLVGEGACQFVAFAG